jgi:hypothetical protein
MLLLDVKKSEDTQKKEEETVLVPAGPLCEVFYQEGRGTEGCFGS